MKIQEHHISIEWITTLKRAGDQYKFRFEGVLDEQISVEFCAPAGFNDSANVYSVSTLPIRTSFTEGEADQASGQALGRTADDQKELDALAEIAVKEQVDECWIFRGKVFRVVTPREKQAGLPRFDVATDEIALRIKQLVYNHEEDVERIRREVEAYENGYRFEPTRERIPESIRIFVWRRDNGRCVRCGSNEKLEFDHIIPVIEGGSSSERNVQLLCETCNREKGRRIAG